MKIERTINSTRNIFFGGILKTYQIVVPFLMRTAMIYFMGVQYLGLNSLFTSVLQVLNLAELGIGNAMVYSMYKPIVEDDEVKICALMKLYKNYYRAIGLVVLILGLILLPFIPNLISGEIPVGINLNVLYLMNLIATVLSYWLFAYKISILQAHQRVDVYSKVTVMTETVKYLLQIFVIIIWQNYYFYVLALLITQVLNNSINAMIANKMYPKFQPIGKMDKDEVRKINHRIRDLFTSKIGAVIVNSADTIVISAFLGLTVLAVYQNYFYLFTAVSGMILIVFTSVNAGIGNSIIIDTKEKVFNDFKKFTFIIVWIAGFCCSCFLCLYQPFMELWVGKDLLVAFNIVICFVVYFFIFEVNSLLNVYKDASGMWHEDRFRPLATAFTNLILNLIMVQFIGLYGIILSTVISMLSLGMPWLLFNLFTVIFGKKYLKIFLRRMLYYVFVTIIVCAFVYVICTLIYLPLMVTIILRFFICVVFSNFLLLLFYFKLPEFKQGLLLFDRMTKGRISILHNRL